MTTIQMLLGIWLALVKDCGFYCEYIDIDECENCLAREFCSEWEEENE